MREIKLHTKLIRKIIVEENVLTSRASSGIIDVYATLMMITPIENTAAAYLNQLLKEGGTSADVIIRVIHDAAALAGVTVMAEVKITTVDRKRTLFHIIARDKGSLVDTADYDRFTVKREVLETKALDRLENS